MDQGRFDSLTRSLASAKSRRGFLGSLAALGAGLLGVRAADAQVTQAQCGNVVCYDRRTQTQTVACAPGCVCCVYGNGNSRCQPAGSCGGTVVSPTTTTTTAAPTTTTAAPTTTAGPTTTAAPGTTTTTTTIFCLPFGQGCTPAGLPACCEPYSCADTGGGSFSCTDVV